MRIRRDHLLVAASFAYLTATNLIWIARDTRPPFWDMAYHSSAALRIYQAMVTSGIRAITAVPPLTEFYPPFFQSVVAFCWLLFDRTVQVSRLANIPAIAILLVSTYGIGRKLMSPMGAAVAAMLVSFYPLLLWLSRETLMDYWLTALIALAMWTLLETEQFSSRRKSIIFGFVCGVALLTKWTVPFFLLLPTIWLARRNLKNAILAGIVAAVVCAYWYVPSGASLFEFAVINGAGGIMEGDPPVMSWQSVVFYVRALEGYQLFLPLFVGFLGGILMLSRRLTPVWIPIVLWIAGGWLGLMLFRNKDPRYTAPLLPAVALVSSYAVVQARIPISLLAGFLIAQHYLVSFGVSSLPQSVILLRGPRAADTYDWNFYTQRYLDLWGGPAREDWKIEFVLDRITVGATATVRLGLIPDIPRFDAQAFEFYIALRNAPVTLNRLWSFDEKAILDNDYVLVSETDHGFGDVFSSSRNRVRDFIRNHTAGFRRIESFMLPNGALITLYRRA